MTQILGVKGEAIVDYYTPSMTKEMRGILGFSRLGKILSKYAGKVSWARLYEVV